ncbi:hypothetical protein EW145_g6511 [Phellinidium pouzarii]|uniref:GDP/GTP exchange factor Sec2 N-terminal domain-containing protein n=1 Tax=Phellinidium pouzarii TaxID=167371 RepID=A0A4S4L135_9AGAM|nr:hypothetical protein EW145_g6511 [Phellinidium pouzarii]
MPGNGPPVPPRTDSLRGAPEDTFFSMLHDELRDMRRVQAYGQEEDLKEALGKTIARVEELVTMLAQAHKAESELETTLKLARSNLQLALANNEMLEDALRREGGALGSKDVGWRRRSDRPDSRQSFRKDESDSAVPSRRGSTSASGSGSSSAAVSASAPTSPVAKPAGSPPPMPPPPATANDTRFFRFRFGSSSASTSPNPNSNANSNGSKNSNSGTPPGSATMRAGTPPLRKVVDASHLTSASLPSLVASTGKREEELVAELEAERAKYLKVSSEKTTLEQEVEGLSQALFEEANKMVAHERIKCAEIEEELRQVREEKEALRSAMRVVEQENLRLRSPALTQSEEGPTSMSMPNLAGTSAGARSPSPEAGSSDSDGREWSRSWRRSASPSSTQGCRQKSSSSERGWASPESALHPGPEPGLENELVLESRTSTSTSTDSDSGNGQGMQERKEEEKEHESESGLGSFTPLTSPVLDMPVEESPWAR